MAKVMDAKLWGQARRVKRRQPDPSVEVRVAHRPATRGRDSVHRRQVRQFLERRPACAARHSLPCHTAGRRYAVAGPGSKEVPMTAPDTPPNDDYVLGRTSEEY